MKRIVVLAAFLALMGCATQESKPAVCNGKHRRPANPYGSVLPKVPGPGSAPPASVAPVPAPSPGPQSSIDPRSFAPCGERA